MKSKLSWIPAVPALYQEYSLLMSVSKWENCPQNNFLQHLKRYRFAFNLTLPTLPNHLPRGSKLLWGTWFGHGGLLRLCFFFSFLHGMHLVSISGRVSVVSEGRVSGGALLYFSSLHLCRISKLLWWTGWWRKLKLSTLFKTAHGTASSCPWEAK